MRMRKCYSQHVVGAECLNGNPTLEVLAVSTLDAILKILYTPPQMESTRVG